MTLIKSISGIRGTIGGATGDNLTPVDVVKFTSAYAAYIRGAADARVRVGADSGTGDGTDPESRRIKIVVGRDARISGEMVERLVHGTLMGCGADVIDAGLCTTPGVEMAVAHYGADGGIILTASHNPRQWNALKLLDGRGEFLSAAAGAEILRMAAVEDFVYADVDNLGRVVEKVDFTPIHIAAVLTMPLVDTEAVRERKFRVVVDAVNSVGGTAVPALLKELGCDVICLNCEPTGEFAHNPEPLPENLTEISATVVREKADLGIVVDPDVDRLALVCEDGTMFGEEYTLVAVADYVLSRAAENAGSTSITGDHRTRTGESRADNIAAGDGNHNLNTVSNLSSTRALADVTHRRGGEYFAAAVGEVNVVAKMKEVGAIIGGEGNGGIIYPALHYSRDALAGIALFLMHLARTDLKMTALRASYPAYYISKNRMDLTPGTNVDEILRKIKDIYDDGDGVTNVTDIDGVKIDFADRWVHLRKSNTEPIIRIYCEAPDRTSADALARQTIDKITKLR